MRNRRTSQSNDAQRRRRSNSACGHHSKYIYEEIDRKRKSTQSNFVLRQFIKTHETQCHRNTNDHKTAITRKRVSQYIFSFKNIKHS